eukprot:c45507_g1_i1 orf=3-296(-)
MKGTHYRPQQHEEVETLSINHERWHNDIALVALLKACAKQKDLYEGSRLHAQVLKRGLLTRNTFIANTLLHLYAISGALLKAEQVFEEFLLRDVVSWT